MKPALQSFFTWKSEMSDLYGRITESPFRNSGRYFKKSWDHHFCDNLEIVILNVDLHWLLKDIQGAPEVKASPKSCLSQKCIRTSKNGKECVQPISRGPLLAKNIFAKRPLRDATLKISNGKMDLARYPWKISPQQDFSQFTFLSLFKNIYISALNKTFNLKQCNLLKKWIVKKIEVIL